MTPERSASTEGNLQTSAWEAPRERQETQTTGTGTAENANVERHTLEPGNTETASAGTAEGQPGGVCES